MKTLTHAILISLSLGCLNLALAQDHFNDRNPEPAIGAASGESTSFHPEDHLNPQRHFKEDNEWVYELPSQGAGQCTTNLIFEVAASSHFNDKYSNHC